MLVAFDENIPFIMVRVFQTLAESAHILNCDIKSAKEYTPAPKQGDVPWMLKFREQGGEVIISGDVGIRGKLHQQKALVDSGFIAFFFTGTWSQKNNFVKCAMLLFWWPRIRQYMDTSNPGDLWEIPFQWSWKELKDVKRKKNKE